MWGGEQQTLRMFHLLTWVTIKLCLTTMLNSLQMQICAHFFIKLFIFVYTLTWNTLVDLIYMYTLLPVISDFVWCTGVSCCCCIPEPIRDSGVQFGWWQLSLHRYGNLHALLLPNAIYLDCHTGGLLLFAPFIVNNLPLNILGPITQWPIIG